MNLTEKTLDVKRVFEGRALTIDVAAIELPDGRRSVREIVRHRGAAVVLGQRPDGKFVLVRQYRRAVEQTLLEMVAGGLEEGEAPEAAARREMEEESGYAVTALESLGLIVPCPGYSEERLYLFFARLAPEPLAQRPDFDENLEPVAMTAAEIEAALDSGELIDGKSIALWLLWRRREKK
ncbi:MAG: NUDIX hydrolase [Verrucomicrobiota bacterium]|jgi:ADP-ribose pyrophosphatase|nr:NUDIX hydrolase [Verrucomicrobiota bacterium]